MKGGWRFWSQLVEEVYQATTKQQLKGGRPWPSFSRFRNRAFRAPQAFFLRYLRKRLRPEGGDPAQEF
mgnify:CR=1 FL=1